MTKVVPSSSCRVSAGIGGPVGTCGASVDGTDAATEVEAASWTDAVVVTLNVVVGASVSTGSEVSTCDVVATGGSSRVGAEGAVVGVG